MTHLPGLIALALTKGGQILLYIPDAAALLLIAALLAWAWASSAT